MSDLDDELKRILHDRRFQDETLPFYQDVIESNVEAIKQAFIDAGYAPVFKSLDEFHDNYQRERMKLESLPLKMKSIRPGVKASEPVMTEEEWEAQAIKDGWMKMPQVAPGESNKDESFSYTFEWTRKDGVFQASGISAGHLMTGREWYDRFVKETETYDYEFDNHTDYYKMMDAAKKASGIEDNKPNEDKDKQ
jgi:hypothetical protein